MYNGNRSKNSDFGLGGWFERKSLFQCTRLHQWFLPIVPKEEYMNLVAYDFVEKRAVLMNPPLANIWVFPGAFEDERSDTYCA